MDTFEEIDSLAHEIITTDVTNQDHLYKLIIIGDTGVGKSCLLLRATKDEFKEDHDVTIGVEFGSFTIKVDSKIIKLQIWDTAGQETFKSVTRVFYKGANCVYLVYDITREESFNKIDDWLEEVRQNAGTNINIILVGNQLDNEEEREVSRERAIDYKNRERLDAFFETSAKSGANVKELFVRTAKMMYIHESETARDAADEDDDSTVVVRSDKIKNGKKKKGGCC